MSMDIYFWSVTELRSVEDLKSIECKSGIPFSCNLNGYLSLASGNVKDTERTTKGQKHNWTIHFSTECIGNGDFYQFNSASSKIFSQFRVSLHFCKKPNVWGNFFPRFCVKSKKFEMCWLCVSPHLSVRTNFQQRLSTFLGLYRGEYIQYNIWGNIFNTISGRIYSI